MEKYKLKKLHKDDAHNNEGYTKGLFKDTYKKVSEDNYLNGNGGHIIFLNGTNLEIIK